MTSAPAPTREVLDVVTTDGTSFRLHLSPDPGAPTVLVLPAMGMKGKHYRGLADAIAAQGFAVATCDLRAQGESRPALADAPNFGYREMLEIDLPAIIDRLREHTGTDVVHLVGHSLGGQLSLLYAAAHPDAIGSVTVVATGTVFWQAFDRRRRFEILWQTQWIGAVSRTTKRWPGGVAIPAPMAGGVMTDWSMQALTGRYRVRGSDIDYNAALRTLQRPVLMISFAGDPLGPKSTVDHLARRMPAASVSHWHVSGSAPIRSGDHFAWLKDSPALATQVAGWFDTAIGTRRPEQQ
ncbi:putative hydrolase [Gordonia polyisoprenivorans VH2]|uniref:Alpha/beta fold hydrolase n=2 Tax=Gordonia polyisoprenivorans TaxID=84595 RepID=A0A846WPD3_9ACTN|nr:MULTISPECIES: alpha/beta fold hydrolase [Gordonia]AFA74809.1 putative hydrolase [Gordonia polyisoprenivorans VH2]MBE7191267.1 alpha/beta fold hydrolase [Gordonia polyisoprenivorans]MDF3284437.1 alpha/beta fold hydrolase [Gordonia sp. N1V]NKY03289.1 alpha/beta fold hydrolase [Gordonia polyisoprenivorans]OPX16540.1 alpha/beta hydrolase [Gordonia sp. i37]